MNQKLSVKWQTFVRVKEFGDRYKTLFAETSPIGQAFARLGRALGVFMREAGDQHVLAREGRETQRQARAALIFRLKALTRTARVIADTVPASPGFDEPFTMPSVKRNSALLAAGKGLLTAAEPRAAQFIANGLPEGFVADLQKAVTDFEEAIGKREAGKVARASTERRLRVATAQGNAAIKAIDVIVQFQFADDEEMQSAWQRAKRQDGLPLPKDVPTSSPTPPAKAVNEPAA